MEYFRDRFIRELNDDGEVEIAGYKWTRHEVLETMDAEGSKEVFRGWVDDAKQAAIGRVREFLTETNCLDRFRTLSHRVKIGNVVPFVGAGMSLTSGFPLWDQFLLSLVGENPAALAEVQALISRGNYEEAGQIVGDVRGVRTLSEDIHNRFGSHLRAIAGPVQLLPSLFSGEVITTNFDYVLPHVYRSVEHPFSTVFCGPELRTAPQRIGNDPHCLLRLHGQGDTDQGRVLTLAEYEDTYAKDRTLAGTLSAIVSLRSLLFLGCSLSQDRTVAALRELRASAQADPPRHYAFLPYPEAGQREGRNRFLSEANIHPIYYPGGDHDQYIEDLLVTLMEGGVD